MNCVHAPAKQAEACPLHSSRFVCQCHFSAGINFLKNFVTKLIWLLGGCMPVQIDGRGCLTSCAAVFLSHECEGCIFAVRQGVAFTHRQESMSYASDRCLLLLCTLGVGA